MSKVYLALQDNDTSRYIIEAIEEDNPDATIQYLPAMIRVESETGLIVASDMKKAKEILNPDGSLEIQKTVAGEAIAFLADETAVSVRLIQYNPHGLLKFVYTIKATEI